MFWVHIFSYISIIYLLVCLFSNWVKQVSGARSVYCTDNPTGTRSTLCILCRQWHKFQEHIIYILYRQYYRYQEHIMYIVQTITQVPGAHYVYCADNYTSTRSTLCILCWEFYRYLEHIMYIVLTGTRSTLYIFWQFHWYQEYIMYIVLTIPLVPGAHYVYYSIADALGTCFLSSTDISIIL